MVNAKTAQIGIVLIGLLGLLPAYAGQSLTIQGKLTNSSGQPIIGTGVQFRVQILAPDANRCILYDEAQTKDLSQSQGLFSINLNDGTGTVNPVLPTTYTLEQAVSNRLSFTVNSTYCASGSGAVVYAPNFDANRKLIILFKDPSSMSSFETIPEMDLNPMAYAMDSTRVGGYTSSSLLRVLDGTTPGSPAPFSSAQFSELQSLIGGTSINYMSSTSGSTTGAKLPTVSGNPASPSTGSIWFDTTGSGALKYKDSSGAIQTVGTGTGSGTITGVTAGTGLSGGGTSGTVTVSLGTSGVTAASYGSGSAVPVLTVDAYGRITSASITAITGTLPSGTAGQFLRSDGTAWTSQKILMGDLKSTVAGADLFSSPACTAAQALYWDSGTDQIKCQNIAINASAITAGTIADARLADVATAGTYKSVTVDAKGRVTSGTNPSTLLSFGITDGVQNGAGVPSMTAGLDASLGSAGTAGRLYIATDSLKIYRDNGTTWDTIASAAGSGGDVTDVVAGTGLSGGGSSGSVTLSLPNVGTAGTYAKVTTDAQGRVSSGGTLVAGDIPSLDWTKITSGTPTTLAGYGITDGMKNAGGAASFQVGLAASRPAQGTAGRFYVATDTNTISYDNGTTWSTITSGTGFTGSLSGDVTGTQSATVVASVGGSTAANVNAATVLANNATNANTASAIVKRDGSGNFSASGATLTSVILKDSGANTATLQAPTTISTSYTLKLPTALGSANQVLSTDASGNLSWVTPAVTSAVSVTSPITNSGSGAAPNIGIQVANTTQNGYLSSTDWNTFNNKQSTTLTSGQIWVGNGSNVATGVAPSSDVSMTNAGAFTVTKIQNMGVSSTAPTSGQYLKYNGTSWLGAAINMGDLKSTISGNLFNSPGCTAAQALYWDSGTDTIKCQSISVDAAAISSGTIANARLPASATMWQDGGSGKIYYNSGNVGIGTTAPLSPLHVRLATDQNLIAVKDGNGADAGAPGLLSTNDANGAVQPMAFTASRFNFRMGNVGIGTTAPVQALDVNGSIHLGSPVHTGATSYGVWSATDFVLYNKDRCRSDGVGGTDPAGYCEGLGRALVHEANDILHINYNGDYDGGILLGGSLTTVSGKMGIGMNTPGTSLDFGNSHATGKPGNYATGAPGGTNRNDVINVWSSGESRYGLGIHTGTLEMYTAGANSLQFGSRSTDGNGTFTPQMSIGGTNGYVGIGTTSPQTTLDILSRTPTSAVHPFRAGITVAAEGTDVGGRLGARTASTTEMPAILSYRSRGTIAAPAAVQTNDGLGAFSASAFDGIAWSAGGLGGNFTYFAEENWSATNHGSYATIATTASGPGGVSTEKVRVTGSGNVGIGTTNPGYTLHVVGTAGLSTGTAWTNASDIRLKDIKGDYQHGLDEILKLHTVRYSYKKDNALGLPSDFEKTGFIAQEVQQVIPEAVHQREDGYLELNVDPIHWAVVNAIKDLYRKWFSDSQELRDEIKRLRAADERLRAADEAKDRKIASLEAKSQMQAARLERLEKLMQARTRPSNFAPPNRP